MKSLTEIIIENNQKAIRDIRELVKENKSENYIVNYCEMKYLSEENLVRAFVREFKEEV